jgi:hypothetical protein
MAKYRAKPVKVTAYKIVGVGTKCDDPAGNIPFYIPLTLDNCEAVMADSAMCARMTPETGDYWVIQEDGYTYLNSKVVFDRKYELVMDRKPTIQELESILNSEEDISIQILSNGEITTQTHQKPLTMQNSLGGEYIVK